MVRKLISLPGRLYRTLRNLGRLGNNMADLRLAFREHSLPSPDLWREEIDDTVLPHKWPAVNLKSSICKQVEFTQPYFRYCLQNILKEPLIYHRSIWELVYICQALHTSGVLKAGNRGLGFGVGHETLPAVFADMGCRILATDLHYKKGRKSGWGILPQPSSNLANLRYDHICPSDKFENQVEFMFLDMNNIPVDLNGFDFCWSRCALEHLGSIEAGLDFLANSIKCLKPGGVAVHTTEYNLSSNSVTVDKHPTVLYRRQDIEGLIKKLMLDGHDVAPLDIERGSMILDHYVDISPYWDKEPHLVLAIGGYASTSIGLIITRSRDKVALKGSPVEPP